MRAALLVLAVLSIALWNRAQTYSEGSEEMYGINADTTEEESSAALNTANVIDPHLRSEATVFTEVSPISDSNIKKLGVGRLIVNGNDTAVSVPVYSEDGNSCAMLPVVKTVEALGARIIRLDDISFFAAYEDKRFIINTALPAVTEYRDNGRYSISRLWIAPGGYMYTETVTGDVLINDSSLLLLMSTLGCRMEIDSETLAVYVYRMH